MIGTLILTQLAHSRNLLVESFDLNEAMTSDKPVVLWHSFNLTHYNGYQLITDNSFGSNIAIGTKEHKKHFKKRKCFLGFTSTFMFVEYDGKIALSTNVWPKDRVYWLGDGLNERYRLQLSMQQF